MEIAHTTFLNFIDEGTIRYKVFGTLKTLPNNTGENFPHDLIVCNFYKVDLENPVSTYTTALPESTEVYFRRIKDEWVVGTLTEQNLVYTFTVLQTEFYGKFNQAMLVSAGSLELKIRALFKKLQAPDLLTSFPAKQGFSKK